MKKIRSKTLDKLTLDVLEKTDIKGNTIQLPNDNNYYYLKNYDILDLKEDIVTEIEELLNSPSIICALYNQDNSQIQFIDNHNNVIEFEYPIINSQNLLFSIKSNITLSKKMMPPKIFIFSSNAAIVSHIKNVTEWKGHDGWCLLNMKFPAIGISGEYLCIFDKINNNLQMLPPNFALKYICNYHKNDFEKYTLDNEQSIYEKYKSAFDYYNKLPDEEKLRLQLNIMDL